MKFCNKCGKHYDDNAEFCIKCGVELMPLAKENETGLKHNLNAAGDVLGKAASVAKEKFDAQLSDEKMEKVKEVFGNAKDKLKEEGIDADSLVENVQGQGKKRILIAVVLIVAIIGGGMVWYMQPEKVIERTIDKDYDQIISVLEKNPNDYTESDIKAISNIYIPEVATQISKGMLQEKKQRYSANDIKTMKKVNTKVIGIMKGHHVSSVAKTSDVTAQVVVVNGEGIELGTFEMQKVDGDWKITKPINNDSLF